MESTPAAASLKNSSSLLARDTRVTRYCFFGHEEEKAKLLSLGSRERTDKHRQITTGETVAIIAFSYLKMHLIEKLGRESN